MRRDGPRPSPGRRAGGPAKRSLHGLVVAAEILRHWRAPAIERVLGRMVAGPPRPVARDLVDVAEILGHAHPGIAHIVEEVRPQHMAAEAPAVAIAGADHGLGAHP